MWAELRRRYESLLLPGIVLQSVLIGGGYASGREVVEYGGRFGTAGWPGLVVIFGGFTLMAVLTFELARLYRAYDYPSWIRLLIGPAWPLFDLLFILMATLVTAVVASAAGSILEQTLGVPYGGAILFITALVALFVYLGARTIEHLKGLGTALLYGAYLYFGLLILASRGGRGTALLETSGSAAPSAFPLGVVLFTGLLYVGYNLCVFPTTLFCLYRQRSRLETVSAGVLAGLLMTLPFILTYLCLLSFYPDPQVLESPVPWLVMLQREAGDGVIWLFGVVVGWTLLETGVGMIHAIIQRINASRSLRRGSPLPSWQSSLLAALILLMAAALSQFGIIALVAQGYRWMAYLFILLFALPLLTVGVVRILRAPQGEVPGEAPS